MVDKNSTKKNTDYIEKNFRDSEGCMKWQEMDSLKNSCFTAPGMPPFFQANVACLPSVQKLHLQSICAEHRNVAAVAKMLSRRSRSYPFVAEKWGFCKSQVMRGSQVMPTKDEPVTHDSSCTDRSQAFPEKSRRTTIQQSRARGLGQSKNLA